MDQALIPNDEQILGMKNTAWWLYIFHAVSHVCTLGALTWIAVLFSYMTRGATVGTFVYSHHCWQIRSFWWYLAWMFAGWILFVTFVGIPVALLIWGCTWLWKAYRIFKGLMDLNVNKAMPM